MLVISAEVSDAVVAIQARTRSGVRARCTGCGQLSDWRHSLYVRRLADVTLAGRPLCIDFVRPPPVRREPGLPKEDLRRASAGSDRALPAEDSTVPHGLVEHVSWLLHEHRRARNTRWRKLGCFKQALLTLVHLRKNETSSQLGAGFGRSQATAWRYVDEALDVLASWVPSMRLTLTSVRATTSSLAAP
ncbi:helix-turn-helix domain-containing protein [Streptomyces wuyuanensis]|uniref:helix-turn-helix domain-containing protein n=1 Tax=Streptomyces wuyuanensis TaxID=1196353 RepID=UPI003442C8CF